MSPTVKHGNRILLHTYKNNLYILGLPQRIVVIVDPAWYILRAYRVFCTPAKENNVIMYFVGTLARQVQGMRWWQSASFHPSGTKTEERWLPEGSVPCIQVVKYNQDIIYCIFTCNTKKDNCPHHSIDHIFPRGYTHCSSSTQPVCLEQIKIRIKLSASTRLNWSTTTMLTCIGWELCRGVDDYEAD